MIGARDETDLLQQLKGIFEYPRVRFEHVASSGVQNAVQIINAP